MENIQSDVEARFYSFADILIHEITGSAWIANLRFWAEIFNGRRITAMTARALMYDRLITLFILSCFDVQNYNKCPYFAKKHDIPLI